MPALGVTYLLTGRYHDRLIWQGMVDCYPALFLTGFRFYSVHLQGLYS